MTYSRIIGTGSYLPERILSNADLEKMVETTDQWIVERTGIRERHIVAENQVTSDLALEAAKQALAAAGIDPAHIDEATIARRMREARQEMSHYGEYDYVIVNDDFDRALEQLAAVFIAGRLRCARQTRVLAPLITALLAK